MLSLGMVAQQLNEEAAFLYYWKSKLAEARLYGDNGLGKEIWLLNQPRYTFSAYKQQQFSLQADAPFGEILLAQNYIPTFRFDAYVDQLAGLDATASSTFSIKKIRTSIDLNALHFANKIDYNEDNFLDIPQKQRIYGTNKWSWSLPNYTAINTFKYMGVKENGGNLLHFTNPSATTAYPTTLNMRHFLAQSQHLIAFRKHDLLLIQADYKNHWQNRSWGLRNYQGVEQLLSGQAQYEYHLENEFDIFRFGAKYLNQSFDEQLDSSNLERNESRIDGFVGFDTYWGKYLQFTTNVNIAYHNLAGVKVSPAFKVAYKYANKFSATAFVGHGWRYANPLTENSRFLFSNRRVQLPAEGFDPEEAWHYGATAAGGGWVRLGGLPFADFMLWVESRFQHQLYRNKLIADLDADAYEIRFYNLQDGQQAHRLSWETDAQFSWNEPRLTLNIDYRYERIRAVIDGQMRDLPFYSRSNWLFELQFPLVISTPEGRKIQLLSIETDCYLQSPQRIPDTQAKTNGRAYPTQSKSFSRWDIHLSFPIFDWIHKRSKWKNIAIFTQFNNILNVRQPFAAIQANRPSDPSFDAGLNWNEWMGFRFVGGFRFVWQ